MRHAVRTVALASGASAIVALAFGGQELRAQQTQPPQAQAQAPAQSPGASGTEDQNVLQQFNEPCLYRRARQEYDRLVGAQQTPARGISNVAQWLPTHRVNNNPICRLTFDGNATAVPTPTTQGGTLLGGGTTVSPNDQAFFASIIGNIQRLGAGSIVCSYPDGAYLDVNLLNTIIHGLKLEGVCVVPSRAIQAADLQGFQTATMTLSQQLMRILGARDAAPVGGAAPATQNVTQPANPQQSR